MGRRRVLAAIGVAALVAGSTAVWAATQAGDAVTTVTGCVASNGQLRNVALSNGAPATCRAGETAVTLSSGDITDIATPVDGGLVGGTAAGAATLSLQQSFRLPQGCASGSVIRYSAALQYWTCGSTFEPRAYDAWRQTVPFTITAVGVFPGDRVLTLRDVPPGKYVVHVTLDITKDSGSGVLRCNTFAEGAGAEGNVLLSQSLLAATSMAGTSVEALPNGGQISMFCRQLAGATGAFPVATVAEITASSVQDWTSTEDTSTAQYGG
jgi:hypothetical protein